MRYITWCIILLVFTAGTASAQQDTAISVAHRIIVLPDTAQKSTIKRQPADISRAPAEPDTSKPKHDPHKATIRSLILPGWGQAYNREYWKIPIVYAAVGIPIGTYFYNNTWYHRTRDAYIIVQANDVANFSKIDKRLIQSNGQPISASSLQRYRNQFRQYRDYSILFTLLAWGLNVVDATVFGHLKEFDVSDDLSMKVKPVYDPIAKSGNIGLVLSFKGKQHKMVDLTR